MSTLFICGAGNPAGVRLAINVNRAEKKWDHIVVLDDNPELRHSKILDCEVIGGLGELAHADRDTDHVVNLVAAKTTGRWKVRSLIKEYGIPFAPLIHPAVDTLGVSFGGDDITVYENATLGAGSHMDEACIVFMNAVLGHGARMDTCSILAPGAVLNARVHLGERAYFGTNASILQDLKVGIEATVGANSSVVGDVPDGATAMGVPAQIMTMESMAPLRVSPTAHADPELEEKIKEIWIEVLNVEMIDSTVNFFDAGGTSLKAMQVFESLRHVTPSPLSLIDVFRFPTIESLMNHLQSNSGQHVSQADKRAQMRRQRMRRSHA